MTTVFLKSKFLISQIILIFLLSSCFQNETSAVKTTISQDSIVTPAIVNQQLDGKICSFSTKDNPQASNLYLVIGYPCDWLVKDGDKPHIVQSFFKPLPQNSGSIESMLIITEFPTEPTTEQKTKFFLPENLKNSTGNTNNEKNIKTRNNFTIDSEPAGEIISETRRTESNITIYGKTTLYFIWYKKYLIGLSYSITSESESQTNELFKKYKIIFSDLAKLLIIVKKK